jgi:hypothetical protein
MIATRSGIASFTCPEAARHLELRLPRKGLQSTFSISVEPPRNSALDSGSHVGIL